MEGNLWELQQSPTALSTATFHQYLLIRSDINNATEKTNSVISCAPKHLLIWFSLINYAVKKQKKTR